MVFAGRVSPANGNRTDIARRRHSYTEALVLGNQSRAITSKTQSNAIFFYIIDVNNIDVRVRRNRKPNRNIEIPAAPRLVIILMRYHNIIFDDRRATYLSQPKPDDPPVITI